MDKNQVEDSSEASSMGFTEGYYRDGSENCTDGPTERDEQHPWHQQPKFARFWQHYANMQSWMQTYVGMHRNACNRYPPTGYPSPHTTNRYGGHPHFPTNPSCSRQFFQTTFPFHPYWNANSQRSANQHAGHAPYYHDSASHAQQGRGREYLNEEIEDSVDSDEESVKIEISQEMLEFFRTSQKFREARDKAKAEAEKNAGAGKKKKNNPVRTEQRIDCRAPVERPDEGRRKGMKVLYGKHTARILGMETAMQMQFDRNCDRLQPAFWPIVALKM